jgi:hypothetical protein
MLIKISEANLDARPVDTLTVSNTLSDTLSYTLSYTHTHTHTHTHIHTPHHTHALTHPPSRCVHAHVHTATITTDWDTTLVISHTTPTCQVVVEPPMWPTSPIRETQLHWLRELGVEASPVFWQSWCVPNACTCTVTGVHCWLLSSLVKKANSACVTVRTVLLQSLKLRSV